MIEFKMPSLGADMDEGTLEKVVPPSSPAIERTTDAQALRSAPDAGLALSRSKSISAIWLTCAAMYGLNSAGGLAIGTERLRLGRWNRPAGYEVDFEAGFRSG